MLKESAKVYRRWLLPSLLSFSFFGTNLVYIQSRGSNENSTRVLFAEQDVIVPDKPGVVPVEAIKPSKKKTARRRPSSQKSDIPWGVFRPASGQ